MIVGTKKPTKQELNVYKIQVIDQIITLLQELKIIVSLGNNTNDESQMVEEDITRLHQIKNNIDTPKSQWETLNIIGSYSYTINSLLGEFLRQNNKSGTERSMNLYNLHTAFLLLTNEFIFLNAYEHIHNITEN